MLLYTCGILNLTRNHMKTLNATLFKALAKKLNLKFTGNFKNGYKFTLDNSNLIPGCFTIWDYVSVNIKKIGDEKAYYFLKGCQIINNAPEGEEINRHWAAIRTIQSKEEYAEYAKDVKAFSEEWDGITLDDWAQNQDQTTYEVYPNTDFLGTCYHGYDTIEEYVIEVGQKDDEFWKYYILNDGVAVMSKVIIKDKLNRDIWCYGDITDRSNFAVECEDEFYSGIVPGITDPKTGNPPTTWNQVIRLLQDQYTFVGLEEVSVV